MSSLGSILSVARSAMLSHQMALEVTGNNVANAETPGYTRQQAQLGPAPTRITPQGNFGTGVRVVTVARAREALLDQDVRAQLAPSEDAATRRDALLRIERVFGEPSPDGLAAAFDAFWNGWSDLAAQPGNAGNRTVVRQRAIALVERFNSYAGELQRLQTDTRAQATQVVDEVNTLAAEIARVNGAIVPAESAGNTANDLRDERDRLLDRLGRLVPITVIDRGNGSNQVMLGGRPLVDGTTATTLELSGGTPQEVRVAGEATAVRTMGGRLGALLQLADGDIAMARSNLDALAAALVEDVNALHVTGWSPTAGSSGNWDPLSGPTGSGVRFFADDAGARAAGGLRLSDEVQASAQAIAAGATLDAVGDNSIALAIAEFRESAPTPAGGSFARAFQSLVSEIAGAGRAAADAATVSETLLQQSQARRDSVSGVSSDEELMLLMRHQQAYAAAARIVQTVDEMMDTLLSIKR
jgi:flagellar hook-associated protein 1 FlgK